MQGRHVLSNSRNVQPHVLGAGLGKFDDRSLDCYYPEAQRRGPRTSKNANKPDSDLASDSSSRSKSARTSSNSTANPRANNSAAAIRGSAASSNEGQKQVAEGACFGSFISYMEPGAPQPTATIDYQPMAVSISDSTTQSDLDPRDSTKLTDCDTSATPDGADDLAGGGVGCEYHGPGAMISICSKSAVTWVCEKTNGRDFQKISARFASDISRRLKLDRGLLGDIEPEPPKQLAWAYCNAFFNGQSRIWFKMIHQATFEARLTSHLTDDNPKGRDDPSWYALRNVVYAIGCRTLDSKQSSHDLQEASQKIQALALMSAFAEGITCPSLDFMLCSDALRLAESKGLHRGSTACLKRETDVHTAGHLWWAIYTHHVMIISRSGRSLQIDDDTITCPLPAQTSGESWGQHAAATGMVKHAQILSSVIRSLNAIRSSRSMSDETFALVQRSDRRLHEWRNSLPRFIQFGMLPGAGLPKGVTSEHCLLLEYSYYTTLIQIHSIVMAPWSKVYQEKPTANPSHQAQIFKSASIVAEASRKIISQLRYISGGIGVPNDCADPPVHFHTRVSCFSIRRRGHLLDARSRSSLQLPGIQNRQHIASIRERSGKPS
ncbi:hypothetical protein ACJZ2D_015530 [Fusarium nematophilum]